MEYRYREPEPNYSIWWQVALGVFIALLAHSVVTGLYARHEMNKALTQLKAETTRAEKQAQRQLDAITAAQRNPSYPYQPPTMQDIAPLRDGERCMQGRRFKRVENGWVQIPHDPC